MVSDGAVGEERMGAEGSPTKRRYTVAEATRILDTTAELLARSKPPVVEMRPGVGVSARTPRGISP